MGGKIYILGEGDSLIPLEEETYEAEVILQKLLADHPGLLAGEQMSPSSPRRWLLISREVGVPGEADGGAKWSLDHLFIDQDGIPTLVEVKRSTNSQIRREVVGQMLDYAANASVYWSLEQIIGSFDRRCEREHLEPEVELSEFLGDDADPDVFWQQVKTNLQAGRVRMVFVADQIPAELRRIIEFLNEQMDPAEVLGLEVHQYVGADSRVLVPKVVGLTAGAEKAKAISTSAQWDRASFLERLETTRNPAEAAVAEKILDWSTESQLDVKWGRGAKNGSASPKLIRNGTVYNMLSVWTDGGVQIQFSSMSQPPFDSHERRREFADHLESIHESIGFTDAQLEGQWPSIKLHQLTEPAHLSRFLEAWDWYIGQLPT